MSYMTNSPSGRVHRSMNSNNAVVSGANATSMGVNPNLGNRGSGVVDSKMSVFNANGAGSDIIANPSHEELAQIKKKFYAQMKAAGGSGKSNKLKIKVNKTKRQLKLRKMLAPKTAVLALQQVAPRATVTYQTDTPKPQPQYTAVVDVDGTPYKGTASTKQTARAIASERALQALFKALVKNKDGETKMEVDGEPVDKEAAEAAEAERAASWSVLGSFAIFKLLSQWDAGLVGLPEQAANQADYTTEQYDSMLSSFCGGVAATTKTPKVKKPKETGPKVRKPTPLPTDAAERHPVTVLLMVQPDCTWRYEELSTPPPANHSHTVVVTVENKEFTGHGRSRKLAKAEAAKQAMMGLYNVVYPAAPAVAATAADATTV